MTTTSLIDTKKILTDWNFESTAINLKSLLDFRHMMKNSIYEMETFSEKFSSFLGAEVFGRVARW
jgi:hypothetical protein